LAAARKGEYSARDLRDLDSATRLHFLERPNGRYGLSAPILRRVCFQRHNLVDPAPLLDGETGWDVILCRNVFIYFEAQRAIDVFHQLTRALTPGGYLLLGASEIVYDVPAGVRAVRLADRLALQRCEPAPARHETPHESRHESRGARTSRPPRSRPSLLAPSLPVERGSKRSPQPEPARSASTAQVAPVDASLQRGHELLEQSHLGEALDCYEAAVLAAPTSGEALMHRGIARYLRGEVELAAKDLRAALFLDEKLWVGAFYLALSYESMGHGADALREYQRLVGLVEQNPPMLSGGADATWLSWRQDIVQLARHRLERARAPYTSGQRS
jgi:chemotaxis protein methyltransferase CheR